MEKLEEIFSDVNNVKIKYRSKIKLPKKIQFGTEIEFENANYHSVSLDLQKCKSLSNWTLKGDVSVTTYYKGSCGGEVVSPILHDTRIAWNELKDACLLIRQDFGISTGRSGAHIHIDSSILNDKDEYILNFIKMWALYEHVIYLFSYGTSNTPRKVLPLYASPLASNICNFLLDYYSKKDWYNYLLDNGTIKKSTNLYYLFSSLTYTKGIINYGFNFHHCQGTDDSELNTIEIRCPNGTLDNVIWQNNINFFTKLLLYCASDSFDKELINKKLCNFEPKALNDYSDIYFEDAIELTNLIFDDELDKMYFLKQYLKMDKYNFEIVKKKALKR